MPDRRLARTAGQAPLERSIQTLPVPLGGLAPVHERSRRWRGAVRSHRTLPILALALMSGASGVWLSIAPRAFDVDLDAAGMHVDGITLTRAAQPNARTHVFTGAATVVIDTASSGAVTAAAVMTWNGLSATGRCVLLSSDPESVETCRFELGATVLTSTDRFSVKSRTWHRQYNDGVEVAITVPIGSTVIPIPFPLGR